MKIADMLYILWNKVINITNNITNITNNMVTGTKGYGEKNYRKGNVNINGNDVGSLGSNITNGLANDTYDFWRSIPSGGAYFNQENMLNNQPGKYGILHHSNFATGYINQTYITADGTTHERHGSGATSNVLTDWKISYVGSSISKIDGAGHFLCTPKELTTTYTSNSYVQEGSFKRIKVHKIGNLVIVHGDLAIDVGLPSGQTIEIGRINNMGSCVQSASQQVPIGNVTAGHSINIAVQSTGAITVYNYLNTTTVIGWARFNCVLVVAD